jgi:DNA-binding transcriptional MocR family regulator
MTIWVPELVPGKPLYLAIADAIAADVKRGALKPGSRLPPHRDLAWRLKVTVGTVTRAYQEAAIRGLLSGEVGRGSYIRASTEPQPLPPRLETKSIAVDLSHAMPPPVYATSDLDDALAHVTRDPARLNLLDYTPPDSHEYYRAMGAKWLERSGIEVAAEDVIATPGAYLGLVACLNATAQPGDGLMAETLSYAALRPLASSLGLAAKPLEMTPEGLDIVSLERAARIGDAKILYAVPTYQNPTTATMARERRDAIVDIARRYNLTIIEDDLFRLLDARLQPPTFYSLAPERTYHITSLSKTLAPGLRLGFVAAPRNKARLLRLQQRSAGARVTGLTAEIARYWIETDLADRILGRVRHELAARRAIFLELFGTVEHHCEPGSPHAWVNLPAHWSGTRFASEAITRGIRVTPGSVFAFGSKRPDRAFRLCFGQPENAGRLGDALARLRQLMDDQPTDEFTPIA